MFLNLIHGKIKIKVHTNYIIGLFTIFYNHVRIVRADFNFYTFFHFIPE
jgi:hypothetical protein